MTISSGQIAISTSAVTAVPSNASRKVLNIKNIGSSTFYLGTDTSCTTANGFPVLSSEEFNSNDYTGVWYAIATTATTADYVEEAF